MHFWFTYRSLGVTVFAVLSFMMYSIDIDKLKNKISIYPILWYIVLANHSYMHFWFTYRSLGVTVFAVLSFMMYSIDIDKLKNKLGGKHWNI